MDLGFWIFDFGFWSLGTVWILRKINATTRRLGSADIDGLRKAGDAPGHKIVVAVFVCVFVVCVLVVVHWLLCIYVFVVVFFSNLLLCIC